MFVSIYEKFHVIWIFFLFHKYFILQKWECRIHFYRSEKKKLYISPPPLRFWPLPSSSFYLLLLLSPTSSWQTIKWWWRLLLCTVYTYLLYIHMRKTLRDTLVLHRDMRGIAGSFWLLALERHILYLPVGINQVLFEWNNMIYIILLTNARSTTSSAKDTKLTLYLL